MVVSKGRPCRPIHFNEDLAKFTDRQKTAVTAAQDHKFILYGGALGGGKALSLQTLIPTPNGWTTVGEIKPGDRVFDENGFPCNVVGVTEIMEGRPCYDVLFSDGSVITADAEHEWLTLDKLERSRNRRRTAEFRENRRANRERRGTGTRPDLVEYNQNREQILLEPGQGTIRTTKEIKDTLIHGVENNHAVPVTKPLQLPGQLFHVDPYVLGAWLGDGTSSSGGFTSADPEIIQYIRAAGYDVRARRSSKYGYGILRLMEQLRDLEVLNDKHIPNQYLRGSEIQRLSLLQGLMDTDGTCSDVGSCEFYNCNRALIEGVLELVLSLGIKARIRTGRAMLNGKDCGPKYRIKFTTTKLVFRLPRKKCRLPKEVRPTQGVRMIVSVTEAESVPVRCIQVDSKSHLYLAGEGMIPTHNSYFLRWFAIRRLLWMASQGHKKAVGMLACENYPALKDRQLSRIDTEFPDWLGHYHTDHKSYGRCFILDPEYGGGVIAFRNLDDTSKYQSAEFCFILVDELTKNDYETFTFLRSRLRWPGLDDEKCIFIGATNPGGIGHAWVKQMWMDKDFPVEWCDPIDFRPQFTYIPSKADDNPHIDASYYATLQTLPKQLRKAFRDGDWDIFVGQAFPDFSRQIHVIEPVPVPDNAPLYMTYDWGFGKPFSIGWWWVDADGRIYRFAEWYGWNGTADTGVRMNDSEVAEGVIKKEEALGITNRPITRLTGHDSFAKRPDYKGGGQGPSTAEVFTEHGLYLIKGDPTRALKLRQFRERLKVPTDGSLPMMVVYDTCSQFIRTIPNMIMDEHNIEQVDSKTEDHCFAAGTLVDTIKGQIPIEKLIGTEGRVLSTGGVWAFYYNCRLTQKCVPVVRVTFSDGRGVVCTPEHKFFVEGRGFVEAKTLTDEACHSIIPAKEVLCQKSSMKQHKSFWGPGTGCVERISNEKEEDCIGLYGSITKKKYLKDAIYTIKTEIYTTTILIICRLGRLLPTCPTIQRKILTTTGLKPCTQELKSGTGVQKGLLGIKNNIKNIVKVRSIKKMFLGFVSFVGRVSWGLSTNAFAQDCASNGNGIKKVEVVSVKVCGVEDVYCLTVPSTHAFCIEGGILVHNCYDESAQICMARPIKPVVVKPKLTMEEKDWAELQGIPLDRGTATIMDDLEEAC